VLLQPGAPAALRADRVRLKQVLLNLLSNAVKYNRDGGRVQVTLRAGDDRARGVLAVRDSGHGISASKMDALFQPFNRLGLESAPIEGTGIGLSIALKLVEQMGGTLEASSEPGVGSEFRVTLQVADGAGATAPEPAAVAQSAAADPSGAGAAPAAIGTEAATAARFRDDVHGSVLCIEDNAANRDLVAQILKLRPNVTLFTANDGASGRVLAAVCQPDLVLLDMRLPDTDGLALFAQLRAQRETARVRCVALSANALPPEIEAARRAGLDGYLTKPLQAEQLLDCIDASIAATR
jgi:CheY-like chemotaxis protein